MKYLPPCYLEHDPPLAGHLGMDDTLSHYTQTLWEPMLQDLAFYSKIEEGDCYNHVITISFQL